MPTCLSSSLEDGFCPRCLQVMFLLKSILLQELFLLKSMEWATYETNALTVFPHWQKMCVLLHSLTSVRLALKLVVFFFFFNAGMRLQLSEAVSGTFYTLDTPAKNKTRSNDSSKSKPCIWLALMTVLENNFSQVYINWSHFYSDLCLKAFFWTSPSK